MDSSLILTLAASYLADQAKVLEPILEDEKAADRLRKIAAISPALTEKAFNLDYNELTFVSCLVGAHICMTLAEVIREEEENQ